MGRGIALAGMVVGLVMGPDVAASASEGVAQPPLQIDDGVVLDGEHDTNRRFEVNPSWVWRGSKTITYVNKADQYEDEVKRAAAAWNKSGANVTWKAVPASKAKVIIRINPDLFSTGIAYPRQTSGLIEIVPGVVRDFPPKQNGSAIATAVLAHEMGHVMGLDHEARNCATMNAILWSECNTPTEFWEYRCRPLEPDDVRGGAKIFGGSPKNLGSPFCALGKEPSAVDDFLADEDPAADVVELTWSLPTRRPPKDLTIFRGKRDGTCPDRDGKESSAEFSVRPRDGQIKDHSAGTGTFCYLAVGYNKFGRPGDIAKSTVEITGSPPVAAFEYSQSAETTIEFFDFSEDPEGDIVSWQWDFGDGSSGSTEEDPIHAFATTGLYEVTLTVTDAGGNSDEFTRGVTVAVGKAPDANFGYGPLQGTTIEFYDYSFDEDGQITSWEWDFGDGSATSSEAAPDHTFPATGDYEVTLTVTDNDGNAAKFSRTVTVALGSPPEADFDYFQASGTTVEFYDYSYDDGAITSREWDFGDGSATSIEENPVHTYAETGEYIVTLTVTDDDGNSATAEYTIFVS